MELSGSVYYPDAIAEQINYLADQLPENDVLDVEIGGGASSDPYGTVTVMILLFAANGVIDNERDKKAFRDVSMFLAKAKAHTEKTGRVLVYREANFTKNTRRFELVTNPT